MSDCIPKRESEVLQWFLSLQTNKIEHSGKTLQDHLFRTYEILRLAGCKRSICYAGLLHSIYGTQLFQIERLSGSSRVRVREIVGTECEKYINLFHKMNRHCFYKMMEQNEGDLRKNFPTLSGTIELSESDFRAVVLLILANLLEHRDRLSGHDLPAFHKRTAKLAKLSGGKLISQLNANHAF